MEEFANWERRDLFRINQVLIDTSAVIRRSDDPYLLLEMTALKLLEMDQSVFIDQLLSEREPNTKTVVSPKPIASAKNQKINKDLIKKDKNNLDLVQESEAESSAQNSSLGLEPKDSEVGTSDKVPELSIENLKKKWGDILERIHMVRPSVGAIIEDFSPHAIEGNTVLLESRISQGFNEKVLERGIPIIEEEISEMVGIKMKAKFKKNNDSKEKAKSLGEVKSESNPKDEKVINKIVDLFDGEILH